MEFSRAHRVRKRVDFVAAQKTPDFRVRAPSFLVLVVLREADAPARLGVVASKKVGGAVIRNRAKRRLRELFRTHERPLGVDLVVIAHDDLVTRAFDALEIEWKRAIGEVSSRARKRRAGLARSDK